jgi:hypothetical protein
VAAHSFKSLMRSSFALFLLSSASYAPAWGQAASISSPQMTYVYFQRTSGHVKFSTPELFLQVVGEVKGYLSASGVMAVTEGSALSSGAELPLSAVQEMARDSGAAYLLYVVVDRPMSKWLKVTVRCYDASGRGMWEEEASANGVLSSGKAEQETLQKLREELNRRLGQPGLQQRIPGQKPAITASSSDQNSAPDGSTSGERPVVTASDAQSAPVGDLADSGATVRLANGTPIHLLLAESISSKSAEQGSTVKLQVLGDVKVGDLVVIANRAPATATIETAQGAGAAWHTGSLLLKLGTVMLLDGRQQPLRAWDAVKGKDTGAAAVWTNAVLQSYGFALLFLPFAPLQHGNEAVMPRGSVLEAVVNGDVQLSRAMIVEAQPKLAEPRHGPASVTFYYPDFGEGISVSVWCGKVKVGLLERGGKFTLTLPTGRYWLRTLNSRRSLPVALDVEDGGEQYVRVFAASQGNGSDGAGQERFAVVPHDVGEAQSADTTQAKSRNVQDTTKLDLTQLRWDPREKKTN